MTTAIPIPPCVRGDLQLAWVQMGGCPVGTHVQSTTIDPAGNVRSCPLSSHVLGNLQCDTWQDIEADPYPRAFRHLLPELCRTCEHASTCHGGCKESAFATSGERIISPQAGCARIDSPRGDAITASISARCLAISA